MWNFLAREANWTEIVTNTLALGFSLMAIVVITYTVLFNPDILAAVGSVTSGITGVILGYYFNRARLRTVQRQADAAMRQRHATQERAAEYAKELADVENLVIYYQELISSLESGDEEE